MSTENTWSFESAPWVTENEPPQSENNPWPAQRKSSIWSPIKIGDSTLSMLDNVPPSPFTNNWTSSVFSFDFDFKTPSNAAPQKELSERPVFGELGNYSNTPPSSPGFAAPGSPCFLMPPPRSPLVPHAKAAIPKQQVFSTKVFIGGIPVGTTVEELESNLKFYGQCVVDWPNRVSTEVCPPNGYAFVVYENEQCVIQLYQACAVNEENKIVFTVAISNGAFKFVELKPFLYGRMTCESCNNPTGNLFCNEVRCLRYFCQQCWKTTHSKPGMTAHQPMKRSQQKRGGLVGGAKGSASYNI